MIVRAVLDTNVLVSGIFWKGPPFEILRAWRQGRFTLVVSIPILEEYRRVVVSSDDSSRIVLPTPQIPFWRLSNFIL